MSELKHFAPNDVGTYPACEYYTHACTIRPGVVVKHFKRETIDTTKNTNEYLYKIIAIGTGTEDKERYVVYEALYSNDAITLGQVFIRPYWMFMSGVDKVKYPEIKQNWRFEVLIDD